SLTPGGRVLVLMFWPGAYWLALKKSAENWVDVGGAEPPAPEIRPRRKLCICGGGTRIAVGLVTNFRADSPFVNWANAPRNEPSGPIWKITFLFGSERSTLATNIEGLPLM